MIEALAKDGVTSLEEFARCADWELAGGYTTIDGKRVKDEGILEPFDMSLAEAAKILHGALDSRAQHFDHCATNLKRSAARSSECSSRVA